MPRRPESPPAGTRYRAAPAFRVVPLGQLPDEEARRLAPLAEDSEFGGVLVPRRGTPRLTRALSRAAADLFRSRTRPGTIEPARAGGSDALARLVLDGVLEVEVDGAFATGAAAHGVYFDGLPLEGRSRLARLSLDAVRHGEALGLPDPRVLHRRLYQFHARPVSPGWRRRLGTESAVAAFLGVRRGSGRGLGHAVERGWHYWRRSGSGAGKRAPAYKLYISPAVEGLPEALAGTIDLLRRNPGPVAVKVGRDLPGLLRADKLVAYFRDRATLLEAAAALGRSLAGMPAHGVPFTADLGGDGLLSWAADPPADAAVFDWVGDGSWRAWVTARLASSLTLATSASAAVPGWLFAVDRLSLDGVDPATWEPAPAVWAAGSA